MTIYRERLHAGLGIYLAYALLIPILVLIGAPFSWLLGVATGVIVYVAVAVTITVMSPVVELTEATFSAGRAKIGRNYIGSVSAFDGQAARTERGMNLDARAWTLFRTGVTGVVKIEITDDRDPAPYWLVATRKPSELAEVLRRHRAESSGSN